MITVNNASVTPEKTKQSSGGSVGWLFFLSLLFMAYRQKTYHSILSKFIPTIKVVKFMKTMLKLLIILLPCLSSLAYGAEQSAMAKKPNIIFILSDDIGIGEIKSFYEPSKVTTPNIDKLAAQGMRFTQAYAAGSVCSPSRYGLVTGTYPSRGPMRFKSAKYAWTLTITPKMLTLPKFLQQQGYRTAYIGKWHLGYGETGITNWAGDIKPGANEIGFDYHLGLPTNHSDNFRTYVENHKLLWLKDNITNLPNKPTKDDLTKTRFDDEVDSTLTAKAIEFIKSNREQPFFIYLALVAVHTHVTPNKRFRGTSKIGQLGDYINELDYHVGEIMATLDKLNLAEDTILIFASDNGAQKRDHHTAGKNLNLRDDSLDVASKAKTAKNDAQDKYGHRPNGDLRGYKGSNFEGGFRVPFIVRWPEKVAKGSESSQVLNLTDMLATTAGLLGKNLPKSAGGDSFDLSPVMLGKKIDGTIRASSILQNPDGLLAFRQGDWKLRYVFEPKTKGKKSNLLKAPIELYNLVDDPFEKTDLAIKNSQRVSAMRTDLVASLAKGRTH